MGLDLYGLEVESSRRHVAFVEAAARWRVQRPARRPVVREALALALIALAGRLAPSLRASAEAPGVRLGTAR